MLRRFKDQLSQVADEVGSGSLQKYSFTAAWDK